MIYGKELSVIIEKHIFKEVYPKLTRATS